MLDAFTKLQKATASFMHSVCPSTWINSAPTGQIVMKIDIRVFFGDLLMKYEDL
jgi:hypothetical protein